jgi:septal ring factor EnvC (AmiA/AmiB activator)
VGKMNFYLSAVDDLLRHPEDRPSIGLILCKEKNRVIAEYALRDTSKPMGVASYVHRLPPDLAANLPSIEQIEETLAQAEKLMNEVKEKITQHLETQITKAEKLVNEVRAKVKAAEGHHGQ